MVDTVLVCSPVHVGEVRVQVAEGGGDEPNPVETRGTTPIFLYLPYGLGSGLPSPRLCYDKSLNPAHRGIGGFQLPNISGRDRIQMVGGLPQPDPFIAVALHERNVGQIPMGHGIQFYSEDSGSELKVDRAKSNRAGDPKQCRCIEQGAARQYLQNMQSC
jgi:hypothetical protein